MPFQTTVNLTYAYGVNGELIADGPLRVTRRTLNSSGTPNVIGYAFTLNTSTGVASVGGTINGSSTTFGGLLAFPKDYASYGTSAGTLVPTLTLADNTDGDLVLMGSMVALVPNACSINDLLTYNTSTGALGTVPPVTTFTASQSTTVLTVTGTPVGNLGVGSVVNTGALQSVIQSLGTGTGGAGTYNVNTSQSVSSTSMTATSTAPTGYAFVPNGVVRDSQSASGLVAVRLTN